MNKYIIDLTRHPISSRGILNWVLWRWKDEATAPLLILTEPGDGAPLDNRIRVMLSAARKSLKRSGQLDYMRFGIQSEVVPWEDERHEIREGLFLLRHVTVRQRFVEHFMSEEFNGN